MDIALVLDKIRPGAAWLLADTYDNLVATWQDSTQRCPTLEEIETAWAVMQSEANKPVTPPVDQSMADIWEAMLAMSAEIEALKGRE